MNRCATCRFLGPAHPLTIEWLDEDEPGQRSGHRLCAKIQHNPDARADQENGGRVHDTAEMQTMAMVVDGSGYQAALLVLPTFGCALWEARP